MTVNASIAFIKKKSDNLISEFVLFAFHIRRYIVDHYFLIFV